MSDVKKFQVSDKEKPTREQFDRPDSEFKRRQDSKRGNDQPRGKLDTWTRMQQEILKAED